MSSSKRLNIEVLPQNKKCKLEKSESYDSCADMFEDGKKSGDEVDTRECDNESQATIIIEESESTESLDETERVSTDATEFGGSGEISSFDSQETIVTETRSAVPLREESSFVEQLLYSQVSESGNNFSAEKFKGTSIEDLNLLHAIPNEKLVPSVSHTITFKIPNSKDWPQVVPKPYPKLYCDKWEANFVRMPCSNENCYPDKRKQLVLRWEIIKKSLKKKMNNASDIEEQILSYNPRYYGKWNFHDLYAFFEDDESSHSEFLLDSVIPFVAEKLCLELPNILTSPVPLLTANSNMSVTLSQWQIASLLANAFFCTFPRRNAIFVKNEFENYPSINFNSLFANYSMCPIVRDRHVEKLKCIFAYFCRIKDSMPFGSVTFKRRCIKYKDFPDFRESKKELTNLHVRHTGTIEDDGVGMLQVDFANKFVGGGVLGKGCVQEEIRFVINPELIVSKLFTEALRDNECLLIHGSERFCNYEGYADSFRFVNYRVDTTAVDRAGRRATEIVAVDAICFRDFDSQYEESKILRELRKAYVGFYVDEWQCANPVATGNWGCGAFGGDPQLKSLLQILAAAECGRDVVYFTFGDRKLVDELHEMHSYLSRGRRTVGEIYKVVLLYKRNTLRRDRGSYSLFSFVKDYFDTLSFDTTSSSIDTKSPILRICSSDSISNQVTNCKDDSDGDKKSVILENNACDKNDKHSLNISGNGDKELHENVANNLLDNVDQPPYFSDGDSELVAPEDNISSKEISLPSSSKDSGSSPKSSDSKNPGSKCRKQKQKTIDNYFKPG